MDFLLRTKPELANIESSDGSTPLHIAAKCGSVDVVKLLLAAGARANATNQLKDTPLHFAAMSGHREVATLLLEKGANSKAQNANLQTPETLDAFNVLNTRTDSAHKSGGSRGSIIGLSRSGSTSRNNFLAGMSHSAPSSPLARGSSANSGDVVVDMYESSDNYSTGGKRRGARPSDVYQTDSYSPATSMPRKQPPPGGSNPYQSDSYAPNATTRGLPTSPSKGSSPYQSDSYGPRAATAKSRPLPSSPASGRSSQRSTDDVYSTDSYAPTSVTRSPPSNNAGGDPYSTDAYAPRTAPPRPGSRVGNNAPGRTIDPYETDSYKPSTPGSRPLPAPTKAVARPLSSATSQRDDVYSTDQYAPQTSRPRPRPPAPASQRGITPGDSYQTDQYKPRSVDNNNDAREITSSGNYQSDQYQARPNSTAEARSNVPARQTDNYQPDQYQPNSANSNNAYQSDQYQPNQPAGTVAKRAVGGSTSGGFQRVQSIAAKSGKQQGLE